VDSTPAPASSFLLRGGNSSNSNSELKQEHSSEGNSPATYNSPTQAKLAFGLKKSSAPSNPAQTTLSTGPTKSTKLEKVFVMEEEEIENKPKKKLVPIDYSDEEGEEEESDSRKRRHRSSGRSSSSRRHHNSGSSDVGIVARGSGDGILSLEDVPKDRKLTSEERKKMTQTLVNSIPTAKEEVFQYQLKWDMIDKVRGIIIRKAHQVLPILACQNQRVRVATIV
jgi:hypothetical protein